METTAMNIYQKIMKARLLLQSTKLNKSGKNSYAGYTYFELGDFLPEINKIFSELGICSVLCFNGTAELKLYNIDNPSEMVPFTSPMATAALKGCHDVQNLGAVQTYLRRYLYINALEIVEHDALDPVTGADDKGKKEDKKTQPQKQDSKQHREEPNHIVWGELKKANAEILSKAKVALNLTEVWTLADALALNKKINELAGQKAA